MSQLLMRSKLRNDYLIVQYFLSVSRFLGFTPLRPQTNPTTTDTVSKIYPLILAILFLIGTLFSLYERFYIHQTFFNISQSVLDSLQAIAELFFVECVLFWSVWRRRTWEKLAKQLVQLENKMKLRFECKADDTRWGHVRFKIAIHHLWFLAVHFYDCYSTWTNTHYALAFVVFRFTTYYIMFSILFATFLCTLLRNRYLYLDRALRSPPNMPVAHQDFSRHYKLLYLTVQDFNALFGVHFFAIAISTVLEILNAVNYAMPTKRNMEVDVNSIGVNIVFLTSYVVLYSELVMACDSVLKSGEKVHKTCLILYDNAAKAEFREEIFKMAAFVRGLRPELSAAGFWPVNQTMLSTIFSSSMTYIIIIIQFNLTLQ